MERKSSIKASGKHTGILRITSVYIYICDLVLSGTDNHTRHPHHLLTDTSVSFPLVFRTICICSRANLGEMHKRGYFIE